MPVIDTPLPAEIDLALRALPDTLQNRSGAIFYSGRQAFTGQRDLYILGLNPGGSPDGQADETVGQHLRAFYERTEAWSEYHNECWQGKPAGTHGMQPRIRHLLHQLGRSPAETPASNVLFACSATEAHIEHEKRDLLDQCWPVHQAVIEQLGVRVILCLGGTAGKWVREKLNAHEEVGTFKEKKQAQVAQQSPSQPGQQDRRHCFSSGARKLVQCKCRPDRPGKASPRNRSHTPLTRASPRRPSISSLNAQTSASALSGDRPGPT